VPRFRTGDHGSELRSRLRKRRARRHSPAWAPSRTGAGCSVLGDDLLADWLPRAPGRAGLSRIYGISSFLLGGTTAACRSAGLPALQAGQAIKSPLPNLLVTRNPDPCQAVKPSNSSTFPREGARNIPGVPHTNRTTRPSIWCQVVERVAAWCLAGCIPGETVRKVPGPQRSDWHTARVAALDGPPRSRSRLSAARGAHGIDIGASASVRSPTGVA
jgi:hypothetical protein